ncbi:MAG: phage terminase large subunit [Ignavibacteria bacterium]|nr:phage terminase large subunit [Ignavibacteria bacterium]
MTLKTRLSGRKKADEKNQIFLTYNPKKQFGYINKKVKSETDIEIIKSSYKDNPMLSPEYISLLEGLKEQSSDFYKIFTLGEYASSDGLIYGNIKIIACYPEDIEYTIYGLDFGYNNPCALVKVDF